MVKSIPQAEIGRVQSCGSKPVAGECRPFSKDFTDVVPRLELVKIFRFMFLGFSDHPVSLPLFGARADRLNFRSFDPFLLLSSFSRTEEYVSFTFSSPYANEHCRLARTNSR